VLDCARRMDRAAAQCHCAGPQQYRQDPPPSRWDWPLARRHSVAFTTAAALVHDLMEARDDGDCAACKSIWPR
jgi:hypothetical protein